MNDTAKLSVQFAYAHQDTDNIYRPNEIEGDINLNKVVECLSLPNYMRNVKDIKKISHWIIKNTDIFHKIHTVRLQNDAMKNEREDNLIVALLCSSNIEIFQQNTSIFKIKEKAEKMYIILEGLVEIQCQPKHFQTTHDMVTTKFVENGKEIGDLDLFLNMVRTSTAITKRKSICLTIKKSVFDQHIQEFYQFFFTDIMNFTFHLKVFEGISNKHQFIKSFFDTYSLPIRYSQGQIVFSEKNQPDCIYFILSGTFLIKKQWNSDMTSNDDINDMKRRISEGKRPFSLKSIKSENDLNIKEAKIQLVYFNIYELQKGDFFGEEDILDDLQFRTFQVSCSSVGGGQLFQIKREVFEKVFMKHYAIEQFFIQNLPLKKQLMADKLKQHSKIIRKQANVDYIQQPPRAYNNPKENNFAKESTTSNATLSNIPQQQQVYGSSGNTQNIINQQQFNKSVQSLAFLSKYIDEIQEDNQDDKRKRNLSSQEIQQGSNRNNIALDKYTSTRVSVMQQQNEKTSKKQSLSSMNDLLDYAQSSIIMLQQQQQLNQQQAFNQLINSNQDYMIDKRQNQVDSLSNLDEGKFVSNNRQGIQQNYFNVNQNQRISSNDLCVRMDNEVDNKQKEQQAIQSIQQRMKQTFEFDMNNYMKQKMKAQKAVIQQKRRNSYSRRKSVKQQINNQFRSTSANNSPSQKQTKKNRNKPTVTKWTNSLNQQEEEMVLQGEISKKFQKNLKQICFKFGRQDFHSLKQSLKNHIKNQDFKKILNANFSEGKQFQSTGFEIYDRNRGINQVASKINYIQQHMVHQSNNQEGNHISTQNLSIPNENFSEQQQQQSNINQNQLAKQNPIQEKIEKIEEKIKMDNEKVEDKQNQDQQINQNQSQQPNIQEINYLSTIQSQHSNKDSLQNSPNNSPYPSPPRIEVNNQPIEQNYFSDIKQSKQLTFGCCSPQSSLGCIELKLQESQQFSYVLKNIQAQNLQNSKGNDECSIIQIENQDSKEENSKTQSPQAQMSENKVELKKQESKTSSSNFTIYKQLQNQAQLVQNQAEKQSNQIKKCEKTQKEQIPVIPEKNQNEAPYAASTIDSEKQAIQKKDQSNLKEYLKDDNQIMQNQKIRQLLVNKGVDAIDTKCLSSTHDGTLSTIEQAQNNSGYSSLPRPYFFQQTNKYENTSLNGFRNNSRPYSSTYHISPSYQTNPDTCVQYRNHSYNFYPLDAFQSNQSTQFSNKMRPQSVGIRQIQKSQSQQFLKLKESKLNSQIDKSNEFKDKKQINVVLNIKKSLQQQNRSNSPSYNMISRTQTANNQLQNARHQLQQIITPSKNKLNSDIIQANSSEQLQEYENNNKQISRNSQRIHSPCSTPNKNNLNDNINQSMSYYSQYVNQPQKQQIKYHFHRKLSSEVNKSSINQSQFGRSYSKQQIPSTFNYQQYQAKPTPQKCNSTELQTNHSSAAVSVTNTPSQIMHSRQSSGKIHFEQNEQFHKNYLSQIQQQPTLFSPDMFQSQQNAPKIKTHYRTQTQPSLVQHSQPTKIIQNSDTVLSKEVNIPKQTIQTQPSIIQNDQSSKTIQTSEPIQIKQQNINKQGHDHKVIVPKLVIPSSPNQHKTYIKNYNQQLSATKDLNLFIKNNQNTSGENSNKEQLQLHQQNSEATPNFNFQKSFNFQCKKVFSENGDQQSDQKDSSVQAQDNSEGELRLEKKQQQSEQNSISNGSSNQNNYQQQYNQNNSINASENDQQNNNPNVEVSFSQQRSSQSEISSPQHIFQNNTLLANPKINQNASMLKYSIIHSTIPHIPEENSFDHSQPYKEMTSPLLNKTNPNTSIRLNNSLHLNAPDSPSYMRKRHSTQFSGVSTLNITQKEQYTRNSIFFEQIEIQKTEDQNDNINQEKHQQITNNQVLQNEERNNYEKYHSNENSPRTIKIQEYLENSHQVPVAVLRQPVSTKQYAPLHKQAQSLYKQQ